MQRPINHKSEIQKQHSKAFGFLSKFLDLIIRYRAFLALVSLYLIALIIGPKLVKTDAVQQWITDLGIFGPFLLFLILLLGTVALGISNDLLAIMAGALFGFQLGFVMTYFAQFFGTLIGYYLVSRSATQLAKSKEIEEKLQKSKWFKWLEKVPVNSPLFLIAGRWIPGYGGDIVYVLAGIYRVPVGRLAWCTAISVLLPAIEFPAIGAGIPWAIQLFNYR